MDRQKKITQKVLDAMLLVHEWDIWISFKDIDFRGLDFKNADLSHINFTGSLLNRDQLEGCNVKGAFISF